MNNISTFYSHNSVSISSFILALAGTSSFLSQLLSAIALIPQVCLNVNKQSAQGLSESFMIFHVISYEFFLFFAEKTVGNKVFIGLPIFCGLVLTLQQIYDDYKTNGKPVQIDISLNGLKQGINNLPKSWVCVIVWIFVCVGCMYFLHIAIPLVYTFIFFPVLRWLPYYFQYQFLASRQSVEGFSYLTVYCWISQFGLALVSSACFSLFGDPAVRFLMIFDLVGNCLPSLITCFMIASLFKVFKRQEPPLNSVAVEKI